MEPAGAIVTGAGSGIGRETARQLAARGWKIALVGRTLATLEETRSMLEGDGHLCVVADVGDAEDCRKIVEASLAELGTVRVLVNNAGKADLLPIDKTTIEALRESYAINAMGPALLIGGLWTHLAKAGGACVVNVSTKGTTDPFPGFFIYASAKASVNLLAMSVAKEGAARKIRGFAVAPGATETGMLRSMFSEKQLPASAVMRPDEVASVIVACIEGEHDDRNGQLILVTR